MKKMLLVLVAMLLFVTACSSSHHPKLNLSQLRSVGITCPRAPTSSGVQCRYGSDSVTVSTASWSGTASSRQSACKAGYVNRGYTVATGGGLTLAADNTNPATFARKLPALHVEKYCPSK